MCTALPLWTSIRWLPGTTRKALGTGLPVHSLSVFLEPYGILDAAAYLCWGGPLAQRRSKNAIT